MDISQALDFVRNNHRAVLATRRADGRPQMSPIACAVDLEDRVVISSRETAYKTKNVRRDPRVSLCVFPDGWYGPWVQVDGIAQVLSLPEALEPLVAYYQSVAGEHPDWDEYRRAMQTEQRVLLRVAVEAAGPNRQG